jgi:hypothetical protein
MECEGEVHCLLFGHIRLLSGTLLHTVKKDLFGVQDVCIVISFETLSIVRGSWEILKSEQGEWLTTYFWIKSVKLGFY